MINAAKKMAEEGKSYHDISHILDITVHQAKMIAGNHGFTVYNYHSAKQKYPAGPLPTFTEPIRMGERRKIYNKYKGKAMKWLTLSDLHYPFEAEEVIEKALKEKVNGVVFSEVFDFYGLSRFRKSRLISASEELRHGLKLVRKIKKMVKNVVWYEANHERRIWALLQDRLAGHEDVIEILEIEPPLAHKMMEIGVDATVSWWVRLGNVIFAHPDWFSNVNLRTAESTQNYFLQASRKLFGQIEAICNNHTHKLIWGQRYGQHLIETGCACHRMDYLDEGKKRLESQPGYAVVAVNADGSLNTDETRIVPVKIDEHYFEF